MMDCKGCLDRAIYSVRGGQGMVCPGLHIEKERTDLQKGGYAGSRRRTVIGLDHRLGPTPRKCGQERSPDCAARL
jgi:hypothetical protein